MKVRPLCKPGPFRSLLRAAVFCTALLCMLDLHAQDAWAANTARQTMDQARDNPRKQTEKRLSIQVRDEKLSSVLDRIEQQTPYVFVYSNDEISISRKITLQVKDRQLSEILDMLLSPLDIRYELINNKIILKQGNVPAVVFAQQANVTIKGRVVGE
ncbi:STN domain-containing protein, partial [Chitinophaga sp.]|uniref:STN domain-containing protein n=1 Tax=Chitinophaga sp. TaxID=1869181 RepID=UPI00260701CE